MQCSAVQCSAVQYNAVKCSEWVWQCIILHFISKSLVHCTVENCGRVERGELCGIILVRGSLGELWKYILVMWQFSKENCAYRRHLGSVQIIKQNWLLYFQIRKRDNIGYGLVLTTSSSSGAGNEDEYIVLWPMHSS